MEENVNIIKLPTDWGEVRERAAVQVLPKCIEQTQGLYNVSDALKVNAAATKAVGYADALVQQLKRTSCLTPTEVAIVDEIIGALEHFGKEYKISYDKEINWLKMQKGNGAE